MKRVPRFLGLLAAMALAAAGVSGGAASAATGPAVRTKAQWQADIRHVREPGGGCYHASYPALTWHAVKCVTAPLVPMAPRPLPRSAGPRPTVVGGGSPQGEADYVAEVPGLISEAIGTFQDVSAGITEQGYVGDGGTLTANSFTLQLNSQVFSGSPACSTSSNPSNCMAWQQFVYAYTGPTTGLLYMQYWLVNYGTKCPAGWTVEPSSDCARNSSDMAGVSALTASQLASVQLTAQAGLGFDYLQMSVGSGQATMVSDSDSALGLSGFWNTTEWGVFGNGHSYEAFFGAGTTLQPQTALIATTTAAPSCVRESFTGETNNLSLTGTPALGSQALPTIASRQTYVALGGTQPTPSCAAAPGANVVTVQGPGTQVSKEFTAVSLQIHAADSVTGQKLTYSATGLPAGLAINAASGLISGIPRTLQSTMVRVTATDTTGASGSFGFGWIITSNTK